jgi:phytoene dehydrogenase-like protein
MFDFIIVGGGMAGLYMGLFLQRMGARFKILEKQDRLGGRAWTEQFAGMEVVSGAGIGRRRKDKLLMQLMKDLHLPLHYFPVRSYASPVVAKFLGSNNDPQQQLDELRRAFERQGRPRISFQQFATKVPTKKNNAEDECGKLIFLRFFAFFSEKNKQKNECRRKV